jgi:XTP/dITP diphosphohydrolase
MKILFASANENKVKEIQSLLPEGMTLLSLKDIHLEEDIPETSPTIEGNALQKAQYIADHFGMNCFTDDTGLEIEVLNGEPGVYSARYAGEEKDAVKNMDLVLEKLIDTSNRKAHFKTVIALYLDGEMHQFEGVVEGNIRREKSGTKGFGYDPIFEPENCGRTFAEMTMEEKNKMSHRGRALEKMVAFLKKNQ